MLKVNNLQKNYKNFKLNCSLKVESGHITGLIGKNGAGKSTTFKAILDLINIDGGTIALFNQEGKHLDPKQKQLLGVVLADSGFSGYLCVKDVMAILEKAYVNFDKQQFIGYCQDFELPLNKKIKDFSTGMKVKLKVIVALTHQARLLILDEPTAGLDVIARDEILDLLRSFMEQDEERAILISSHIASDLESLCDDLYMIDEGNIIFHEDTDVLLSDYALLKVNDIQYDMIDKKYILKHKKESYGYACLTKEKQFYMENYRDIVAEKANIDTIIMMMVKGE